jgi:hypothetical protein
MSIISLRHRCKRSTSTPRAPIGRCWLRRIMAGRLSLQPPGPENLQGTESWPQEEQLRQTARTDVQTMPPISTRQTVRLVRIREALGLVRRTRILSMPLMGIIRPTARQRIRRIRRIRSRNLRTSLRRKVSRLRKASRSKIHSKQERELLQARDCGLEQFLVRIPAAGGSRGIRAERCCRCIANPRCRFCWCRNRRR